MTPDTILVAGLDETTLRRIWDGVKRSGVRLMCTKEQAEKMEKRGRAQRCLTLNRKW